MFSELDCNLFSLCCDFIVFILAELSDTSRVRWGHGWGQLIRDQAGLGLQWTVSSNDAAQTCSFVLPVCCLLCCVLLCQCPSCGEALALECSDISCGDMSAVRKLLIKPWLDLWSENKRVSARLGSESPVNNLLTCYTRPRLPGPGLRMRRKQKRRLTDCS